MSPAANFLVWPHCTGDSPYVLFDKPGAYLVGFAYQDILQY